jgi:tetratricopeptide (TPR) repeat protein
MLDPESKNTLLQAAMALHNQGLLSEAQQGYQAVLALDAQEADALHLLGVSYFQQGLPDLAIPLIWASLQQNPANALAYGNLGNAFQAKEAYKEAIDCYDVALGAWPDFTDAHFQRGNALYRLGRNPEAIASYDQAIDRDLAHAEAYFNRGVSQQLMARHDDALGSYRQAIRIKPGYVEALNNQGNTLQSLELFQDALDSYALAQGLAPGYGDAHWNEALCRLKTGDFEEGWKKYEWRWDNHISNPLQRLFAQPLWSGAQALSGKSILLHAEQGFGDTIQFCRYAEMVALRGAEVTLEVQPSLMALLKNVAGVKQIVSTGNAGKYDFHCPLLSLPLAFDTRLSSIPASRYYLASDRRLDLLWGNKLGKKTLPRIGLVWSGNPANPNDLARSAPLLALPQLLRQDIQWYCLHKELSVDSENFLQQHAVQYFSADLTNFSETASLISQMDLVISVDTAVAHLAAALGKPTWLLLAHCADFRWLLGRRDSPWYPSMRLFRQASSGDWEGVFACLIGQIALQFDGMDCAKRH